MLSLTTTRDGLAARRTTASWLAPLCLALAAGLLYSINLGRLPQPDELHHAIAARGLLAHGIPSIAEGQYDRVLLHSWMVAGAYALFGDSLAVARLPSVLCMAVLVGLMFVWLRRELTPRQQADPLKAQHLSLVKKLNGHYAYYGITSNFDAIARLFYEIPRVWRKALARRSQQRFSWPKMNRLLERFPLPAPRIVHQYGT